MKKLTLSIAIIAFLAAPFSVRATSPTIDAGNAGIHGGNLATNSNTTAQNVLKTLKDYGLDQVAYMLAQKLGQKMATATINKTTGGASSDKDPNYIQDFTKLLSDIEQQQRDLWTTKLLTSSNPYARNISAAILSSPAGDILPQFTLGSVLTNGVSWQDAGSNLELAGEKGLAFYAQLAMPQNTSFGASIIADQIVAKSVVAKQESERLKVSSDGFLPNTECNVKISDYKNSVSSIVNNSQQANQNSQTIQDNINTGVMTEQQTNQNAVLGDQNASLYMNTGSLAADLAGDTAGCIEEMIKNPVATTQVLTNEAGKFGMDMTKNIQGWGQIVAGLFVSLFNGFVNQGLSSLKADYGQVKKATNVGGPEQLTVRDANGNVTQSTNFANTPMNIVDLRNDLDASMKKTSDNLAVMEQVRSELIKVPAKLATLDICLPGPDYLGLTKRMDDYYSQQSARLMKRSMMGDDEKRNSYQSQILTFIERDFDIAKSETQRDMNDDTKNMPGAGVIRVMLGTFQSKKTSLQAMNEAITKANEGLTRMRQVTTDLKGSVSYLMSVEPGFASLPGLVFTTQEWNTLVSSSPATADAIYNWLLANSGNPQFDDPDLSAADDKRNYVIASSWGLWEYPYRFLPDNKWSDDVDGVSQVEAQFTAKKNEIRSTFSSIKDSIPTDWEINKNEQLLTSYRNDNIETDNLIHDCDMFRVLLVGDGGTNTSAAENAKKIWNGSNQDFIAAVIANNNQYETTDPNAFFKSESFRNSFTLPNIMTTQRTWAEDGCIPNAEFNTLYQATDPTGRNFADHGGYAGGDYTCMGDFGYLYGAVPGGDAYDFDDWIDRSSNAYQVQTHVNGAGDAYGWRWPLRRFSPDPSAYGTGWTITMLTKPTQGSNNPPYAWPDGGEVRPLFCRLNSVLRTYGKFSGSAGDHLSSNFYCSSKWTDTSIADAVGSFIVNSIN